MTLDALLLQRLAETRSNNTPSPLLVDHDASGWRVQLSFSATDSIGVRLQSLELVRLRPLEMAPALEGQARSLAQRITGLLEPLQHLETDASAQVAQLRSVTPERTPQGFRYYEVLRHANGTTRLHRYQANGGRRESIEFTLTNEALAKLLRDLTD
jgi:hypothetical protein